MSINSPYITVLLCTYNDEANIAESIQSILDQSYTNLEFIILNDGSTDGTVDIIQSYSDPRIKYLEHEQNKGLEESKNWGITEARGKYIAYIDGDDIAEPNRLRSQVDYMESHPNVGICSTKKRLFGLKNVIPKHKEHDIDIRSRALFGTPMEHPSCMIRTQLLRDHEIRYRKDFPVAEDYPFMVDMLEVSQAYCIQSPLIRKRIHNDRISVKKKDIQEASAARASQYAFKVLLGIDAGASERTAFRRCFFSKSIPDDLEILEQLKGKVMQDELSKTRDPRFRMHIIDLISKSMFDIKLHLEKQQNSDLVKSKRQNSSNFNSTSILRVIVDQFLQLFRGQR